MTDWFQRLTGFVETDCDKVREKLFVQDGRLHSRMNGSSYAVGELELVSIAELKADLHPTGRRTGRLRLRAIRADVRELHQRQENAGALFQVASQFNLLEMTGPSVSPEDGVTRYAYDHTQGPACAIAAGAATIYRNYFALVEGGMGQTADRQLDGLSDLGLALSKLTGRRPESLWIMQNGYALASEDGLQAINAALSKLNHDEVRALKELLRLGLHSNVEVTDEPSVAELLVSQIFCSAMPLGYSRVPAAQWERLARLVLESAYDGTLAAAVRNSERTGSNKVFVTLLGAGAFGNPRGWVLEALMKAVSDYRDFDLDVAVVSHSEIPDDVYKLISDFEFGLG